MRALVHALSFTARLPVRALVYIVSGAPPPVAPIIAEV
jgi:hypothetical protein